MVVRCATLDDLADPAALAAGCSTHIVTDIEQTKIHNVTIDKVGDESHRTAPT